LQLNQFLNVPARHLENTKLALALQNLSPSGQDQLYAAIRQTVGPLIIHMAGMAFDPMPRNVVFALMCKRIQLLPQVGILHGLLGCRSPAAGFPAMNPFGDALAHVLAVQVQGHIARAFKSTQSLYHRHLFHPVVGGV
jgi:hypothetical protein